MFKTAYDLEIGDVILEGRHETTVIALDKTRCMGKVHVNGKDCYERFADVKVKGEPSKSDIALGKLKAQLTESGYAPIKEDVQLPVYALAERNEF